MPPETTKIILQTIERFENKLDKNIDNLSELKISQEKVLVSIGELKEQYRTMNSSVRIIEERQQRCPARNAYEISQENKKNFQMNLGIIGSILAALSVIFGIYQYYENKITTLQSLTDQSPAGNKNQASPSTPPRPQNQPQP